jgi:hypothetical protein
MLYHSAQDSRNDLSHEDGVEIKDWAIKQALEEVVDSILDYGQYPYPSQDGNGRNIRPDFDLLEYLTEQDPEYAVYVFHSSIIHTKDQHSEIVYNHKKRLRHDLIDLLDSEDYVLDLALRIQLGE